MTTHDFHRPSRMAIIILGRAFWGSSATKRFVAVYSLHVVESEICIRASWFEQPFPVYLLGTAHTLSLKSWTTPSMPTSRHARALILLIPEMRGPGGPLDIFLRPYIFSRGPVNRRVTSAHPWVGSVNWLCQSRSNLLRVSPCLCWVKASGCTGISS